jgi:hypothetical protein
LGLVVGDFESCEAESFDGSEDVVCGFCPSKRLGPVVDDIDIVADGLFQLSRRTMHPATDLLLGQLGEESLDLVDPGR